MREECLKKAQTNLLPLFETVVSPTDPSAREVEKGECFVLDLGSHYVGYFSFALEPAGQYPDAPVRLRIRFCETARALEDDYTAYREGLRKTAARAELEECRCALLFSFLA